MDNVQAPEEKKNWTKIIALFAGIFLFLFAHYSPPWFDANDPTGKQFVLSQLGKGALAVFFLDRPWLGF